jgi:hypothetical protein
MQNPSPDTLYAWATRWESVRAAAYRDLVASYTPEQRALVRMIGHAARQKKLCYARARWPKGSTGKHPTLIRWPQEPPAPSK